MDYWHTLFLSNSPKENSPTAEYPVILVVNSPNGFVKISDRRIFFAIKWLFEGLRVLVPRIFEMQVIYIPLIQLWQKKYVNNDRHTLYGLFVIILEEKEFSDVASPQFASNSNFLLMDKFFVTYKKKRTSQD